MEKEFVPYELALKMKQLGFDEPCFGYYGVENEFVLDNMKNTSPNYSRRGFTSAPLYQQAFRWFREKYQLCNFINFSGDGFCSGWEDLGNNEHGFENFTTYEEAEFACLKKLIEITENK
jgi:hypothetical protein